jgi:hypothetical protein
MWYMLNGRHLVVLRTCGRQSHPMALERPRLPQPVLEEPPKPRTDKDAAATAAGDKRRAAAQPSPPHGPFMSNGKTATA